MLKLLYRPLSILKHIRATNYMKASLLKVPEKEDFPQVELNILKRWNEINAFKTQLELNKDCPKYTFYDGPPFATGLPHYGNLLAGTVKDICTRYASMSGFNVERRFGWDCHGLPIENKIDKEFNLKTPEDHENFGIKKYNDECRKNVMKYSKEWRSIVGRFGRWIDFDNDYKTMDLNFMETVWWVFKQIYEKGLVYRSSRIMPYSTACTTVLSNFEAGSNYKDVPDPSILITFPLEEDPKIKLVAWTTTPWTLPSNMALVVNPTFTYLKVSDKKTNEIYIIGEPLLKEVSKMMKAEFTVIEKITGKDLEFKKYIPLFDYFIDMKKQNCFQVLCGEFVTADTGTGIVHAAPAFGEEDFNICCVKYKIISPDSPPCPLDAVGKFVDPVTDYKGIYIKDADKDIKKRLKEQGRLLYDGTITHSYPYCWRSDTPLIYKAVQSWFIKVTDLKERLIENNKKSKWVPKDIQEGRFHNWLAEARDWCFSRNRYWGNPIPIWASDDFKEIVVIGSIEELKQLSGLKEVTDLHRDFVDNITIPSKQGKGMLHRIPEVFDCWFESGSMPFSQFHYPFGIKEEEFNKIFPADFIAEGLDQTRGWFYTLLVISTAIKNNTPFKNLIVHGLVLASDGKKMSKSKGNYPDPVKVADEIGADACRLYLASSPVVKAEELKFKKEGVTGIVKDVFLPWYNAYRFLVQSITRYENKHQKPWVYDPECKNSTSFKNPLDLWILAATQNLINYIHQEMGAYRLYTVAPKVLKYFDNLTNWYVKLNRNLLKGDCANDSEWNNSLNTLFEALLNVSLLMAPLTPFITESIYLNLRNVIPKTSSLYAESIHFLRLPKANEKFINPSIEEKTRFMQSVIILGRMIRDKEKLSFRMPLKKMVIVKDSEKIMNMIKESEYYIKEELNVLNIEYSTNEDEYVLYKSIPDFKVLGKRLGSKFKPIKELIPKLESKVLKEFKINKKITLDGSDIIEGDLVVTSTFTSKYLNDKSVSCASNEDLAVLLSIEVGEEQKMVKNVRELCNTIQKARKKAKVNVEDNIEVFFETENQPMNEALLKNKELVLKTLKKPFGIKEKFDTKRIFISEGKADIDGVSVNYWICPAAINFNTQIMEVYK